MGKYLIRKLFYGVAVMLGIVVVVFFLFNILPVDPARMTQGQRADVQSLQAIRKEFGLDKPVYVQFAYYLNDLSPVGIHANTPERQQFYHYVKLIPLPNGEVIALKWPYLRRSYQTHKEVASLLLEVIPNTLVLATTAMIFAILIGVFLGVQCAIHQNTWIDKLAIGLSTLGVSAPSFFVAIIVQLTRNAMLDVLGQDYIRTAKAKGLSNRTIVYHHALKNALNPVMTAIANWFASLLAGSFFVEYVFGYNGLGKTTVDALEMSDFPVVMGSILFIAFIFVVINMLVDIIYFWIDPRVKLY